jgi:selenocysteine lyase/cysteine desulfurase
VGLGIPAPGSPLVGVAGNDEDRRELERAGIKCAGRAGALRFAFHLYNDEADVDRALEALSSSKSAQRL